MSVCLRGPTLITGPCSRVNEDSILAIQIFDQKKFKKKDQGFLGVINVRIGDVIDLQMGGDGESRDWMVFTPSSGRPY